MTQPPAPKPIQRKPRSEYALIQLLPNMLTVAAICAGLTAIRFGVQGNYLNAVQLILLSCVLDGIDGRLARILRADSAMGAELDSLADFLNFGVAPPLLIYYWALQDAPRLGWLSVLVFAVCCVVRLARFNVSTHAGDPKDVAAYFTGVPSPAGAMLVMLPMYLSFAFDDAQLLPDLVLCLYMAGIGLLLISRIPTWSFKTTKVSRENVKYFLVAFAFVAAALMNYAWLTLIALCLGYVATVVWALVTQPRKG
ncbi:CDP-diacylglycerol--serine O-phosphatidyltransferase [Puniceibacterium sp. IMCC21224]|uniref:CDP-diacylglycerol--serine O-phosphatidyltransferase n=1 Tax=Puniceibacterium sp. IMCC21224 TaxID=1618204 RepID=UPI00064E0057|nr:CDP-diacylglycerol--serine O-phosphatidyltransferase [Puniceibacterium sp. IMCC21224]KMK68651.1 CDP-diacylglycerol--serine O-phosphatidyltransferase [Puniceibacterium sp. IMCC21224]